MTWRKLPETGTRATDAEVLPLSGNIFLTSTREDDFFRGGLESGEATCLKVAEDPGLDSKPVNGAKDGGG